MNGAWLQYTTLRVASLLVPSDQRTEWIEEWRSELWYVPQCRATIFCMGAFRDAFWLRRNHCVPLMRTRIRLESPLSCLALLATLAVLSIFVAFHMLAPRLEVASPLKTPDLAGICIGVLTLSCLLLPVALWVWRPPASRYSVSWSSTLRRGIFLVLKIALLQSIVLCGSIVQILLGPLGAFSAIAGGAAVVLALPETLPLASSERNLNLYAGRLQVFDPDYSPEQRQYAAGYRGTQAKIAACGDCLADREEVKEPRYSVGRYRAPRTLDNNVGLVGGLAEQTHRLPIGRELHCRLEQRLQRSC
jgi:hypothetical protein